MTPLDLLDTFDGTAAKIALVATYEFDPLFFERRVLRKRGFAGAERILVLMDAGRYQELLKEGLPVSGFNRRYLVAPIDRHPYVFHPKLYLLIGERRVTGIVGSSNCTNAGIAFNVELCSTFSAELSYQAESPALFTLRQIFQAVRSFAADAPDFTTTLQKEFFARAEDQHPWLADSADLENRLPIELLHSHHEPLWPHLKKRLKNEVVRNIAVFAPFYDRDLTLLKTIKTTWPGAKLSIFAQPQYATLEGKKLAGVLRRKDRLMAVTPPAGRRLHAKAFAFETSQETFWLSGSANATVAAMNGRNTEAALWFSTKESIDALFRDESLTIELLAPAKFEAGPGSEPNNQNAPRASDLVLGSTTLQKDGSLDLTFDVSPNVQNLTVRITNFNEAQPFLSLRLGRTATGRSRIDLKEDQVTQIGGAAICELKGTQNGREVLSNRVALVQLHELLREHSPGAGSSSRLHKISETGEELVAHLDNLGTVREAIEFLDHCSIRFEDGEPSKRGLASAFWKPRDPFVADIPTQWLSEAIDNTAEDLREAVWRFVTRHQHDKLEKHVRRGNLNGLPNFLDIFRTLNGLLITFNKRNLKAVPVIPHPFVTSGIMTNLDLLMGTFDTEGEYIPGFIDSINANFEGDRALVRERLGEERVPQILRAAVEAMIEVRRRGMNLRTADLWAARMLKRTSDWIDGKGLPEPSAAEIQIAGTEYISAPIAA
jgi:HKD family nuclease